MTEPVNRRGNGLSADAYAPLVDLTTELADAMLAALREAGVAAYASEPGVPSGEPAEPAAERPLERLYVDTSMRSTAESVLHAQLDRLRGGGPAQESGPVTRPVDTATDSDRDTDPDRDTGTDTVERDDDAVWAEIVASFDAPVREGAVPWPEQEDLGDTERTAEDDARDDAGDDDADDPAGDEAEDRTGRLPTARVIKASEPAEADLAPDDEGHYIPPPPPPLPTGDSVTRTAWAALVGGPLYLLITSLLGWDVPGWIAFIAVAAFIGGFVALVLRMGDDPRGPDAGAVV